MFQKEKVLNRLLGIVTTLSLFVGVFYLLTALKQPKEKIVVKALFNKQYKPEDKGKILSWVNTGKALSAVSYHKGVLLAPLSFDFGGGLGEGAFVAYNVDNPEKPNTVFDSRDYPERFHDKNSKHYLGDIAENHGMYFHKDYVLLSERGFNRAGFMILNLAPLYDDDSETLPEITGRFYYPEVQKTTIYDGFSFSPVWAAGRYVYAPTGSNGLYIVDTENLEAPKLICHLRKDQLFNQTLRSANAIGDLLVLSPAAGSSSDVDMVLLDISNPAYPSLINKHKVKIGYQGIVYGSRFYNGAYAGNKGKAKTSHIIAYDFSDLQNIKEINLATTDKLFKSEYMYIKDDDLYIGNYPGLSKWKVHNDKATFDMTIEPQQPAREDYAFVSPLGNLTVVTSDHIVESRMNIGVNDTDPDTRGPEINNIVPKNGQKNVSVTTKIGISFSDFISDETLENGAIVLKERGTTKVVACNFGHGLGIVHAIPVKPLKDGTTYDVFVTPILADQVGNPYVGETLVASFSTGDQLVDFSTNVVIDTPQIVGDPVHLKAILNHEGTLDDIVYAWNFGDGSENTAFSKNPFITETFSKPGNYSITLIAKQKGSDKLVRSSSVQVVHTKLPKTRPVSSSSLALTETHVFSANPDNNTITAIDVISGKVLFEQSTGKNPAAIAINNDELWVSCKGDDQIVVHNINTGEIKKNIKLWYGAAPHGLVINKQENLCYAVISNQGWVQQISTKSYRLKKKLQLEPNLRNISFVPEKQLLVVPQSIAANQKGAKINYVDTQKWKLKSSEILAPTERHDDIANGRGYPNYMGAMAVNPEQSIAWVPGKKDNLFRGLKRDGEPLVFDHTVRSIAVSINLDNQKEIKDHRIDLDNSDFASAATYNNYGNIVYISSMGSQTIWAVDAYKPNKQAAIFNTYGEAPNAMLMNDAGTRLYVHNHLSRKIAVFNAKPDGELKYNANWQTVSKELLSSNVLEGKRLFNNTTRGSMAQEGYMSCASCHIDGSHDGRVWDISNLGEGFRNTIDLRGKEGMKHGMLHWSGNFDEVQDFNDQIKALNQGTGFMFHDITKKHPQLGETKFGIHKELDNLAAYVSSLNEYPKSPFKKENGKMTKDAFRGRKHFISQECYTCHSGPTFTDSYLRKLHDVGTQTEKSGNRLGGELTGFDTPSLISIWQSAPYLHDGSAKTLNDVFEKGKGKNAEVHKRVTNLNSKEIKELLAFLNQLDDEKYGITNKELGSKNTAPIFEKEEYTFDYKYKYYQREQIIGDIIASDKNKNQELSYTLLPTGASGFFTIDEKTGSLQFDYIDHYFRHMFNNEFEYKKKYEVDVLVRDSGSIIEESVVSVTVNITYPKIYMGSRDIGKWKKLNITMDKKGTLLQKDSDLLKKLNNIIKDNNPKNSNYGHLK